ncbi:hypothetical protein CC86DRAFT_432281 [Ophiobolus disseminans]|uniref:Uncharacterized protein n=1 Tax=Ophiobolus disseminans TaxID=1469910 RepID=A0A6A6ZFX8_9PLEO|nr:hypothetical protein CC86DRAFT_432281 [Ophiobolus disseminans]
MSEPNAAPTATMVHPSDAIIQEIKDKMSENAYLLDYLRLDRVRIEPVKEKNKPSNALPHRMHFGSIPNSRYSPTNVSVLLCVGPAGGPPEQRYRTITRLGEIIGPLSAEKAATEVVPASAFWGINERGFMDPMKVRAVIRYYFIAMKVKLPLVWPIDLVFIKELTAACRLAKVQCDRRTEHSADTLRTSNITTAPAVAHPAALPSDNNGRDSASVQKHPDQDTRGHGTQDIVHATASKPPEAPKNPLHLEAWYGSASPSRLKRSREPPRFYVASQSSQSPSFTSDDRNKAREAEVTQPQQSANRVETQEQIDFISSYRKIIEDEQTYSSALEDNRAKQTVAVHELAEIQSRLGVLREEEKTLKQGRQRGRNDEKHLRHTLSERERAILELGIELERQNKRVKLSKDSSSEGGDEEE